MKTGGIVVCSTFVALVYIPEYPYGRSVTHTFWAWPRPVWRMPPEARLSQLFSQFRVKICPIPSIFVEAILTCSSGTDLAPEIYDILNPSPGLLGWNLQWVRSSNPFRSDIDRSWFDMVYALLVPEESISPLAKPFITLPLDSCYGEQRTKYNRFLHLSGSRFSLFLFLTPPRVVPNVWHFPYFVGATSTNSLMIKLQPKIYDHIMFTVRISFIPSVCSQVPVILIRLPEPRREASVETFTSNRRFFMVFPLITAALSTPPDIWCQIVARFPIYLIIELAISVALIVQVREEGWTSRMRESGSIDKKEE
ncbi:hypothetical protein M5K25_028340 [Dendrobium thyrsiflorum]|uniref:Transport membrane protein n=1 Tax=Dendrobium thyrsiflorum TaxID=117978 RepID=A0ABD0TTG3_DENTH